MIRALWPLLFVAVPLAAQRTWIVDAARGTNYDHADLPAAVAQAGAGDRIVVRPGAYHMFEVTKALAILAEPGVRIASGTSAHRSDILIRDLPAGAIFSLHGVDSILSFRAFYTRVENCAGTVILEGAGQGLWRSRLGRIRATDCADVRIMNGQLEQMEFVRSRVVLERSVMSDSLQLGGVQVTDGRLHVAFSEVRGSSHPFATPTPAVTLTRGRMVALRSQFHAGKVGVGPRLPVDAVAGDGIVVRDAGTSFSPSFGGRPLGAKLDVRGTRQPAVEARGGPAGGRVDVAVHGVGNHRFALFLGLPSPLVVVPGLPGELGLAPIVPFASGVLDATGSAAVTLRVPPLGALDVRGLAICWQALTHPPGQPAAFLLSNPSAYVHGLR